MLKIISGGQTGVDRAALDAALALGIDCGGWCPKGRRAEDGPIDPQYPLVETTTPVYPARTRMNVRDSDGTLILTRGQPDRGTALTAEFARKLKRPLWIEDFDDPQGIEPVRQWLEENRIAVLNVAGPRESSRPGIYEDARAFLGELFRSFGF